VIARLRRTLGRPIVVGHRGAPAYAPENTLASFRRALELGADMVECDVHLTADGTPIVIHDETLDRTSDGCGPVDRAQRADVRRLDAGAWFDPSFAGERIPTLDELLDWASGRVAVAIELKGVPYPHPQLVELTVAALRRHAMLDRAALIAFDHPSLAEARRIDPNVTCGVLYACRPVDAPALAHAVGAEALLPEWSFVVAEDVAHAHAAGLVVQPWESSDAQVITSLLAAGVDGVASDRPDVARAAVDAAARESS
jgi:glycerophosphoryl diester phosphodiesterase